MMASATGMRMWRREEGVGCGRRIEPILVAQSVTIACALWKRETVLLAITRTNPNWSRHIIGHSNIYYNYTDTMALAHL